MGPLRYLAIRGLSESGGFKLPVFKLPLRLSSLAFGESPSVPPNATDGATHRCMLLQGCTWLHITGLPLSLYLSLCSFSWPWSLDTAPEALYPEAPQALDSEPMTCASHTQHPPSESGRSCGCRGTSRSSCSGNRTFAAHSLHKP